MLMYGFAWLNSGDVTTFTQTFLKLFQLLGQKRVATRYICGAAQYFSQLQAENTTLEQALKFQLTSRDRRLDLATRVKITWLKLASIIFKMFYAIPDFTYAIQSRFRNPATQIDRSQKIKEINLVDFSGHHGGEKSTLTIPLCWRSSNYIDLNKLSNRESQALIDVVCGIVPHIRGSVAGNVMLENGHNLLRLTEQEKFHLCRYVGGKSSSRQVLGPTVQLELAGSSSDAGVVAASLEYWELQDLKRRRVQELSGGQRVRLALASAMASKAFLIVLDGVEDQLDIQGRKLLNSWISSSEGQCIFFGRSSTSTDPGTILHKRRPTIPAAKKDIGEIAVQIEDISLVRGGKTLIAGWSHTLRKGTLTLLTGPNGSGKTSLALALGGALKLSSGNIKKCTPLGMSFQNPLEQVFCFTVGEELLVRLELANASEEESLRMQQTGLEEMGAVGEDEVIELNALRLRLLSCHAMLFRTGILILDEPTNSLNKTEVSNLVDYVDRLKNQGVCVLIITHDPEIWHADEVIELENV